MKKSEIVIPKFYHASAILDSKYKNSKS